MSWSRFVDVKSSLLGKGISMSEPRHFFRRLFPAVALTGALTTALVFPLSTKLVARDSAALAQENQDTAESIEGAFTQIADNLGPATVSISALAEVAPSVSPFDFPGMPRRPRRGESPGGDPNERVLRPVGGSGVIVRPDGYIVTNDHVVEKARDGKVKVKLASGESYTGVVFRDKRSDLAVIKINPSKPLPTVKFADSDALKVGQWAIAIGSPFGQDNSVTAGIVSALHRKSMIGGANGRYYPELIQTDASINPGNSGGPLFNIHGELIGVNVAIDSPSGGSVGIGFAIPANSAKLVVDQLVAKGKVTRGYLGVKPIDIEPEVKRALGIDKGAYVAEVTGDGPADKAGIDPGDVVVRFNERPVSDESTLRHAIAISKPGTTVPITLLRSGKTLNLTATLEVFNDETEEDKKPAPTGEKSKSDDFEVEPITAEYREDLNLPESVKGVVVTKVKQGTPAEEAGLGRGLVIVSLNGKPVTTAEEVKSAVKAVPSGKVIMVKAVLPPAPNSPPGTKPSRAAFNIEVP